MSSNVSEKCMKNGHNLGGVIIGVIIKCNAKVKGWEILNVYLGEEDWKHPRDGDGCLAIV